MLCVTKLIHHCCQHTLSLQNAFRNFQQCSLERKHGIVLKKYSPEDNQKSKLAKKKAQTTFPLKCVLLLQIFMKSAVHLSPEGFFCFVFLHMSCSYIFILLFLLSCMYWQTGCPFIAVLRSRLILYFFLNNGFSHLQKRCFISEILFQIKKYCVF